MPPPSWFMEDRETRIAAAKPMHLDSWWRSVFLISCGYPNGRAKIVMSDIYSDFIPSRREVCIRGGDVAGQSVIFLWYFSISMVSYILTFCQSSRTHMIRRSVGWGRQRSERTKQDGCRKTEDRADEDGEDDSIKNVLWGREKELIRARLLTGLTLTLLKCQSIFYSETSTIRFQSWAVRRLRRPPLPNRCHYCWIYISYSL